MTEQEIKQRINDSERQIQGAYQNLRNVARILGENALQAAYNAKSSNVSQLSGKKARSILLPLLISVVGLFLFKRAWFLALLMVIGGIALAVYLYKQANEEQSRIRSEYNNLVINAENQQKTLNAVIDNNTKI